MAKVKEIFKSIQGEGPYCGYKQLFIRFCGCNLNCGYCDTKFDTTNSKDYSISSLLSICNQADDCHSISLTGGEPLIHSDFLKELLPLCKKPIYLETNATLFENLNSVIDYISYVSADIKLPSATNLEPQWENHDNFFEIASKKELFAKIVFNNNIKDFEIEQAAALCCKYNIPLILQPMMENSALSVSPKFMQNTMNKFLTKYKNIRLIPQIHKFINVE